MKLSRIHWTLLAGLAAGLLFLLPNAGLLIYLPLLPLLLAGFSEGATALLYAGLLATAITFLLGPEGDSLFFALFLAFPAWYLVQGALRFRGAGSVRQWHPLLAVFADLALFTAVMFLLFALLAASEEPGGLQGIIVHELGSHIDKAEPSLAPILARLATDWSFAVFAAAAWMYLLIVYGMAVLANSLLAARGLALRESLAFAPQGLSPWLAAFVGFSAAWALLADGNARFEAETIFLILLFPYFLSGLALLHQVSRGWQGRSLWLIAGYSALILFAWPAVILVAAGIYVQLAEMLAKRREVG